MVIITRRVGRLGNRLLLFAHFIACARENNILLCNPAFHEYARHFEATRHDLFCRYRPQGGDDRHDRAVPWEITRTLLYHATYLPPRWLATLRCTNWPVKTIRLSMGESWDLDSRAFAELLQNHPVVLVQGWAFRGEAGLRRHADVVRAYFRPIRVHTESVSRIIATARNRGDLLVGVHCRRGDYRTAFGGKFFYSAAQYQAVMQRIRHAFAPRQVSFLVCDDGLEHRQALADLNVTWGSGHPIEDLYSFAECDYLVGPPSTFTGWAAFYGRVPLCQLTTADAEIQFTGGAQGSGVAA